MNISVILAHPHKSSFNHAIAQTVLDELGKDGSEIAFHDLYEEKFDPILPVNEVPKNVVLPDDIKKHCKEISEADGIIIIHPNWWGQPPAILKGWIDRVIRAGVAYEFLDGDEGEGIPNGLLRAKAVLVLNTSNTKASREQDVFRDPLETIWKNCVFGLCGVRAFHRKIFCIVVTSSEEERRMWLEETRQLVRDFKKTIVL